jgi:hypothetical protein
MTKMRKNDAAQHGGRRAGAGRTPSAIDGETRCHVKTLTFSRMELALAEQLRMPGEPFSAMVRRVLGLNNRRA